MKMSIGLLTTIGLVLLSFLFGCGTRDYILPYHEQTTPTVGPVPAPVTSELPASPSDVTVNLAARDVTIVQWRDNSNNELGFRVYRNGELVGTLPPNAVSMEDRGLQPATAYRYSVKSYNNAGESWPYIADIRTPNPGIVVRLDKIGVFDNREGGLRGPEGEIYVICGVSGGVSTQKVRFPSDELRTYVLEPNEIANVGSIIYSTDEIGDFLTLGIVGYEKDGDGFEGLAYEALGLAIDAQTGGGTVTTLFGSGLSQLIGSMFGAEDDWLGTYEHTWNQSTNWGVGQYLDVTLKDERGVACLRLWFTIYPK